MQQRTTNSLSSFPSAKYLTTNEIGRPILKAIENVNYSKNIKSENDFHIHLFYKQSFIFRQRIIMKNDRQKKNYKHGMSFPFANNFFC